MRFTLLFMTFVCLAGSLSGCYTVRGVGDDVAATGSAIGKAAQAATPYP